MEIELTVLVTTFQKERSIGQCLVRLYEVLDRSGIRYKIVILDDASTDATVEIARLALSEFVEIRKNEFNVGKGMMVKSFARSIKSPYTAVFDGDLDLHPDFLVDAFRLIKRSPDIGAVIGSKLHSGSIVKYPLRRRILSYMFRRMTQCIFKLECSDSQTGAKVFRTDYLIDACSKSISTGFVFDLEVIIRLSRNNLEIREAPILLDYNFDSSIGIKTCLNVAVDLFRVWKDLRKEN